LNAHSIDALYDLQEDPNELHNLLAGKDAFAQSRAKAERLKQLLVDWLERTKSPRLPEVKARILKPAS
jgi:hypothetical protein